MTVQGFFFRLHFLYINDIDIQHTMEADGNRYKLAEAELMLLMKDMQADPNIVHSCGKSSLQEGLERIHDQFALCEKALLGWLELKRQHFPRFYFLSDDEMARVLSEGPISPRNITRC